MIRGHGALNYQKHKWRFYRISISIELPDSVTLESVSGKGYNFNGNWLAMSKEGKKMASEKISASLVNDRGVWTVKGRVYDPLSGKKRQRTKSTGFRVKDSTKRKAEAAMKEIVAEWQEEASGIQKAVSPPFSAYVQRFIDHKRALRKKENTIKSYQDYANLHVLPKLGIIPIQKMALHDLESFYADYLKTHTVGSARKVNVVISGAFREAIRDGVVQVNLADADHLEFPKAEKFSGGSAYTPEEVAALLDAAKEAGEPIRAAVVLGVCYGLRRSEALGLRWRDIDFESGTLTVSNTIVSNGDLWIEREDTKTEKSHRTIDLLPNTVPYLKGLKKQQEEARLTLDKVCVWPNGERVRPDYVTYKTKQLMKTNGLRVIRFHDLRHTAASLLAPIVSPQQLQRFMGHEDIGTTYGVYAHLLDKERKATSDAMNAVLKNAGIMF